MSNCVFYVEDDPDDIVLFQRAVSLCGCTVEFRIFNRSPAAADWLVGKGIYADRAAYPLPCLLVTDINMPLVDGFDLITSLRTNEATRDLPVIVVSSSGEESDKRRAAELGVNGYLIKSADYSAILRAVRPFACPLPAEVCTKRRAPQICQ
jgi:two-component system response regulator